MRNRQYWSLLLAFVGFAFFSAVSQWRASERALIEPVAEERVVIAAPVLLLLFGGDRFLAANLETMRLAATGVEWGRVDNGYLTRAQYEVARLNPCHEDNFYLANGLLAWGGAESESGLVLMRASDCRFWDEFPPFFYGFNKYFFERDKQTAVQYLELAAQRSTYNAAGFRKLAIMLKVEGIKDERVALELLQNERDQTRDPKLKDMLAKRAVRLEGLVVLREAQRQYEKLTGQALEEPLQLLKVGLLEVFPEDPLKLGYEFIDGRFMLKKLKVAGVEER
ncbi:hypothetical protein HNE05_01995 [Aquipseudomonas campi]|uniref:Uncharacterized protein n=1 Tax=Aquipseudomonas campi TaxID=2731681 RepID=A0A6M8F4S5_9GAMM|nr:hypothetical protein [Pseudomonas campi]QKE62191.1 hypothetical protein HNE05_01995 [Pseudomonas campi]